MIDLINIIFLFHLNYFSSEINNKKSHMYARTNRLLIDFIL